MISATSIYPLYILMFLLGGSNDLLDYVPTYAYWQIKQVHVTLVGMTAELEQPAAPDVTALIDDLSNADPQVRAAAGLKLTDIGWKIVPQLWAAVDNGDPETSNQARRLIARIDVTSKPSLVRRLMAIRTLGELKQPAALATLKPLLDSKEQFEADYAAAAIAQIERRPNRRPTLALAKRAADAWAMPHDCASVLQIVARSGHPVDLSILAQQCAGMMGEPPARFMDECNHCVIETVEEVGNIRLNAVTIGCSPDVDASGYVVVVFHCIYDHQALAAQLQQQRIRVRAINGMDVYQTDASISMLMPDDNRLIAIYGPDFPNKIGMDRWEEIVAAVIKEKNTLHSSTDLAPLLTSIDMTQPVWGIAKMTPSYKQQAADLDSFDTIRLSSTISGDVLRLKMDFTGNDVNGARSMAADFNNGVSQLLGETHDALLVYPCLLPVFKFVESLHADTNAGNATITGQMPRSLLDAMLNPNSVFLMDLETGASLLGGLEQDVKDEAESMFGNLVGGVPDVNPAQTQPAQ
jgi:hypothetical protein